MTTVPPAAARSEIPPERLETLVNPAFDPTDTTFMMIATCLVMVMTPGLAFFYAGLVGRRNVVAIMMQSFVALGVSTVLWVLVGYSLCFSGDNFGVIGNLDLARKRDNHKILQ